MADWLSRLRERIAGKRGDVIVANVGEGARDVVVGKNIIKVGTLVVPATPVLIGVIVFIVLVALGAYVYFIPDKMPPVSFNVAVAEFGEIGMDGRVTVTENSQMASRAIFTNLRDELTPLAPNLAAPLKPVVWHDSLFPTQIRARISQIPGNTAQAQKDAAKKLATDLRAQMIIYGNLKVNETPATFVPEFFVAPLTNEADEIVGQYQFGAPITIRLSVLPGSDLPTSLALDQTFITRRKALAQLTFGLMYDLHGDHEQALARFEEALTIIQAANTKTGEDVLYYFLGREYLILANKKQAESETLDGQAKLQASAQVEPLLAKAEEQFTKSLAKSKNYARAHAGMGSVARLRALRQSPQQRLEKPDFLNTAFAEYQTALSNAVQDREPVTQSKMQIYLGTTFFLQGEAFLFGFDWQKASGAFDESIRRIEQQVENLKDVPRSLGEAYLTLGNAYYDKGIAQDQLGDKTASRDLFNTAIGYYDKCIALKKFDETTALGAAARCERYQAIVRERAKQ